MGEIPPWLPRPCWSTQTLTEVVSLIRDVLPGTLVLIKTEQTFLMSIMLARLSQVKRRFHIHVSKAHSNNRLHIQS